MPSNFSFVIPGKLAGCGKPGGWGDPRSDLAGLSRLGIGAIVSLTEERIDRGALAAFSFRYLHLPIRDFHAPTQEQLRKFIEFVDSCLADGIAVATHCGAGIGRTGTMLSGYFIHHGMKPAEAILHIRMLRPGSVETPEQEKSLETFYKDSVAGGTGRKQPPRA